MKINKILISTIVTSANVCAQVQHHRLLRGGHIRRLAQHNNPYSHTLVEAKLAQNTPSCNRDIKICLIGSGYDCAHFGGGGANQACHEDLPKAGVSGDSFDTDTDHSSPWWQDEIGSGTHNAGILAAVDNDRGVVGLVEGVSLYIARVLGPVGDEITADEFRSAVRGCINVGANIINFAPVNNMVGGGTVDSQVLEDAVEEAYQEGILFVAGAGDNAGKDVYYYPASYKTVISVTSIGDQMNQDFNANVNDRIELSAPGIDIDSTIPGSAYQLKSGTGVAATHVSGVAALVWSHYPGCTHTEIRQALQQSAEDLGVEGRDDIYGYGLVKAKGALDWLATNPCNNDSMCPEPPPPTTCATNEYVLNNACAVCPSGTTNVAGDDTSGGNTSCDPVLCPSNQRVVSNTCMDCPVGSTNEAGDDASGNDTTCDPLLCAANEFVSSNTCTDCPAGTTNAQGDDASGNDTTCDPVVCGVNEYVLNNACTTCQAGTTNDAGDDSSGANTECTPTICGVNEYVLNNACTPCPAGSTSAGGEDASSGDTSCIPTLCPSNQKVLNNACVPCEAGTTNDGGDNASGSNTVCDPITTQTPTTTTAQPIDECPNNPNKTKPGICGCDTPDTDSDNDGTPDCVDACPNDKLKTAPGKCGCGNAETKPCHGHGDGHGGSGHSSPDEPDVDYSKLISDLEAQVDNAANSLNDIHITMPAPTQNSDPSIINNEVNSNILMQQAPAPRPPKPEKVKVANKKVPRKRIKPQKVRRPPNKLKKMPKPPKPVRTKRLPKPPKPPRVRRPPKTRVFRPPPQKAPSCSSYEKQIEQLQTQKMNLQQKNKDLKDENIQLRRMNRINANRASKRRKSNIFKKV